MKLSYDDAVEFLEENGLSCDPGTIEGDCVCNLLDDYGMEDKYGETYYTKKTLKLIMKEAKENLAELDELSE